MKILIFIGLKLAEIMGVCGIIGIVYCIGWAIDPVFFEARNNAPWWVLIFEGAIVVLIPMLLFQIGCLIGDAIKANWAWADRINKGKK